ncbi:hypothetical protein BDN67DRAFT_810643 [Paxillus ammoniavirescens]|nr:hypothetical protein BDN67DRAFT_810643 [Paxillus ammoniavirescens]
MVRQAKQTKKEAHKKKTPQEDRQPKKKVADSGIWPCKINGCNKQFAREADLKRHQRTTKLHSIPGFPCPQCDARFTRTDALRRHQKSRHNGVVVEPTDVVDRKGVTGNDGPQSSGSKSKSRSISPSSRDDESPSTSSGPASSLPPATAPPPGGPQSYYRQHTLPAVLMPPPGMMIDGHYPPGLTLPTSATRLHQASWPPPPPWGGDGSQPPPPPPHMIHIGYPHPYYNTPPPYYRPDMMHPTPDLVAPQQVQNGVGSPNTGESSSSRTGSPVMANMAVDPSLAPVGMERASGTEAGEAEAAVIDPSLVSPSSSSADVRNAAERESSASSRASGMSDASGSPPGHGHQVLSHTSREASRDGEGNVDNEETVPQDLPSSHAMSNPNLTPLDRPPEMEQMLTEDGEPMLNPAELLTQESLASPPPS